MPRYAFGTAWRINALNVNGEWYPVRDYNPNNFVLNAGLEKGSCPIILVWDDKRNVWVNRGNMLIGAVGYSRKSTDAKQLDSFSGKIRIAEIEGEDFFLDQIYAVYKSSDGGQEVVKPRNIKLAEEDNQGLVISGRSWLDINLRRVSADNGNQTGKLVMTGFYTSWYNKDTLMIMVGDKD